MGDTAKSETVSLFQGKHFSNALLLTQEPQDDTAVVNTHPHAQTRVRGASHTSANKDRYTDGSL